MILKKLSQIESNVKSAIDIEKKRLEAIKSMKVLFEQVDCTVEVVPAENVNKLTRLMTDLKGEQLNKTESDLIKQIVK